MDNQAPTPNPTPPAENISPGNPPLQKASSQVYTAPRIDNPPPPKKPFMFSKILLPIMIILVLFGAGGIYLALNSKPKPQACTQDEKICPDGTSVGRNGPNCTFTPCPSN